MKEKGEGDLEVLICFFAPGDQRSSAGITSKNAQMDTRRLTEVIAVMMKY